MTPMTIAYQAILDGISYTRYLKWCVCRNYQSVSEACWNQLQGEL